MFVDTPAEIATAWTNFIRVDDSIDAAAERLLAFLRLGGEGHWAVGSTELAKADRKNPDVRIQARKRQIAGPLGLGPDAIPFLRGTGEGQYFFLKPGPAATVPAESNAAVVIHLCLLAGLLHRTAYGANAMRAQAIGPHVYLGARSFTTKQGQTGIEAFELGIRIRHNEIQATLSARVMQVAAGEMVSGTVADDEHDAGFVLSNISPTRLQKWDARKSRPLDITFDNASLRRSRLFLLNRITELFCAILQESGVRYQRTKFSPSQTIALPRLSLAEIAHQDHAVLIVNNTGARLVDRDRERIIEALRFDGLQFRGIDFYRAGLPATNADWTQLVDARTALLVLNPANAPFGSVRIQGDPCSRPWEAYHGLTTAILAQDDVDRYTWAKYVHLYRRDKPRYPVLQGLDCSVDHDTVVLPDVPVKKMYELRRCALELGIKCNFAQGKVALPTQCEVEGDFTLIHTDSVTLQLGSLKGEKLLMAAIVKVRAGNGAIQIVHREFHPDLGLGEVQALTRQYPCLQNRIWADHFFVVDDANQVFLQRITGALAPKILLNAKYGSIEQALDEMARNEGLLPSGVFSRGADWALLPFYVSPGKAAGRKWRDTAYIEDRGMFLRYFVPSLLPAEVAMGFSNLHDLMVFHNPAPVANGSGCVPVESGLLGQNVVKLYLATLTSGILRLEETSKASLLEKLASLGGMDT
ncbi:hypothetical protein [Cupriavidus lacunae]|uniref:Uncharacterized protein n=1 Tax=Cupriavidus lacunae TaxID=2666307 RepID=A0A370MYC1_9BURK|nr:hypothetical protein [Cupriavidus lacunae]RDJ98354.1 hypothetical protein DN412_41110 [Cupriavidus lacunae]